MKKQINYILLVACCLFASCAVVNELTINVQKPAKVSLPKEISTIVIANNSVDQPNNINHTIYRFSQEIGKIEVPADGLGDILVETLTDNLVESNMFDGVFLSNNLVKDGRSFLETKKVETPEADSILTKYGGQLLLTLDRYAARLSSDAENVGDGAERLFCNVEVYADFSMYDEFGEKKGAPILYRDTLVWEAYLYGSNYWGEPLPSPDEALRSTMFYVADELTKILTPQWVETQRWIYSNASTEMRRANTNMSSEKWEVARDIWSELYQKEKNRRTKGRLASNIALSYELSDDLNTALEWAEEAEKIFLSLKKNDEDVQRASYYVEDLKTRILDFKLLDLQDQH